MAVEIGKLFPGCPPGRAEAIARHAAQRGSGRVGRTAAGRALGRETLELAVLASVRHQDTEYDELLMSGVDRATARDRVRDQVTAVLDQWRHGVSSNRHARAQTLSSLADPRHECRSLVVSRIVVRHAALSVQFDTCLRAARAPTHPGPTDPMLAPAAQRPASAGFRSDVKQLSGLSTPPRPQEEPASRLSTLMLSDLDAEAPSPRRHGRRPLCVLWHRESGCGPGTNCARCSRARVSLALNGRRGGTHWRRHEPGCSDDEHEGEALHCQQ